MINSLNLNELDCNTFHFMQTMEIIYQKKIFFEKQIILLFFKDIKVHFFVIIGMGRPMKSVI